MRLKKGFAHCSEIIEEMRYRVDEILESQPNTSEHGSPEKWGPLDGPTALSAELKLKEIEL